MRRIRASVIAAFIVASILLAVMTADAAIETTNLEIRGQAANETAGLKGYLNLSGTSVSWHPQNFAGLFYDIDHGFGNENLKIVDSSLLIGTRTIPQNKLIYTTRGDNKLLNAVKYPFNGDCTAATLAGLKEFQAGSMSSECGKYVIVGWQADKYVAVKNKTNKLSRLIIEQGGATSDKKTLSVNETWDVGGGWRLTVTEIKAPVDSPRYVRLNLSKDGVTKNETVVYAKNISTYVESSIGGESGVPLFVTYVDAIFRGATTNLTQLRYTWAIDTNFTQIRTGDRFGVFNVTAISGSLIELKNTMVPVSLSRDSTVSLMDNIVFKVADSDILRFYPASPKSILGTFEVRGQVANETRGTKGYMGIIDGRLSWRPQNFAGLYYDLNYEHGNEELKIIDSDLLLPARTIPQNKLIYTTSGNNRLLNAVKYPFNSDCTAAMLAGLKGFQAGSMSSECGKYVIVGWQADKYVAVKNKTNKLSKLIIEQGRAASEKKTLLVGEAWEIGGGWTLTAQSIDARASPRQAWLILSKDGIKKEDIILAQGQIYTRIENLTGETNVPVFLIYLDSVFAGAISNMVQLRYTWAIDTNVTQIRVGDKFGVFDVTTINPSVIRLQNTMNTVPLSRDSIINLMGSMNFKVADSDTLRFYPMVYYKIIPPPIAPCYNSTINGYKFKDENVNGFRDSGELGLSNWTIRLKGKNSCTDINISRVTRTNATGYFEFRNVPTGTYLLSERITTGWIPTTPGIYQVIAPHFRTTIRKDFGNIYYP